MRSQPLIAIPGRSGCKVEIVAQAGVSVVRKFASHPNYNERLARQIQKQREFASRIGALRWFRTPAVLSEELQQHSGLRCFTMDYVAGQSATHYLAQADPAGIRALLGKLLYYFRTIHKCSTPIPPPRSIVLQKVESLLTQLGAFPGPHRPLLPCLSSFLLTQIPHSQFFLGYCHGDFTLSNMLFGVFHIYLVDFLDSFLESPVFDVVKIRQDTRWHWTLLIDSSLSGCDAARIQIALGYLDDGIREYLTSEPDFADWYPYLEILNLARILPYLQNPNESDCVTAALRRLLHDYKSSNLDCPHGGQVHPLSKYAPQMAVDAS